MKFQHPLNTLITSCETICLSDCCGIDAYDFSPIHIASYLISTTGGIEDKELEELRNQLKQLRETCGTQNHTAQKVTIEEINQILTPQDLDQLIDEIENNLEFAIELINITEEKLK
ncbi:DUF6331 family protein [Lentisphaera profundi]|uniref:DUF6331 family protein n=1 Tax=Lentisphaera profundi TaxID=1658616 RepID=A0ABY7VRS7_9BACT|nr:DUF6331 family protein [Lentisphaera profundi]WDE95561.1 DUF6331 family protein [Lentisphaera profundi]